MIKTIALFCALFLSSASLDLSLAQEVSKAELARVRYELSKVEQKLKDAGGQPIELSKYDLKAFAMVKEVAERDPDNPSIVELISSAKKMYNEAKGVRFELTPEMISYRTRQTKVSDKIGAVGDESWSKIQSSLASSQSLIEKTFPVPLPPEVHPEFMIGKSVVLPEIEYEKALFVQTGYNWIAAGNEMQGFYFIDGSCREFNSLFEAMQRYRDRVQNQIEGNWTFIGSIDGPAMLAPEATLQTAGTPQLGWRVRPTAIHVPGVVTITLDESSDLGATFAGEDDLKKMVEFSITSVPDDIQPIDLIRIYVVALKEKNWDLHLECIEPSQRSFSGQLQSLRYNWEVQQKGLENYHVHAEPTEVSEVKTTIGNVDEDLEDFFGDGEERVEAFDKEERAIVTVQLFNEKGVQTVRPRYVTLVRTKGGRWYIWSGATLTF